jgi:hypothetical protein
MRTEDVLIVGAGLFLLWVVLRPRTVAPRALVPSVTTEEFFTLPYYLDINSGLFDLPGGGLVNQNVSQSVSY